LSKEKRDNPSAEEVLAGQVASDPSDIREGKIDIRRLSNISVIDKVWMPHFLLIPDDEGGEYAKNFVYLTLNLAPSVDGKRVRELIQTIGASTGAGISASDLVTRPNILSRNITNRGWKDKADRESKQVVE